MPERGGGGDGVIGYRRRRLLAARMATLDDVIGGDISALLFIGKIYMY